jgi:hypothetical protein
MACGKHSPKPIRKTYNVEMGQRSVWEVQDEKSELGKF